MPTTIFSVFGMFFPAALICGGAYLAYLGFARVGAGRAVKGRIMCAEPALSHATRTKCAYSRTVVERYGGGSRWIPVAVLEAKAPFSIGREQVRNAAFEISEFSMYKGYAEGAPKGIVKKTAGLLSKSWRWLLGTVLSGRRTGAFGVILYPEGGVEKEVNETDEIPKAVIASLLSFPAAAEVRFHLSRPLRIREYVLPLGARATMLAAPGAGPFVSDMGEEAARAALRERSFAGIAAGGALILVGILAAIFMML